MGSSEFFNELCLKMSAKDELDLNPAILYHKIFALVDARMILAEPAIRSRAVDISRDRLMSRQVIFDAHIDCGNS